MARNYTEAQLRAIESNAKRLLVCAAAGSGKTTVLTERILRYVSDPDTPGSLSRLIVVTFTRAAASELRDRIRSALEAELEANPTEHLTHEILSIAGARISTIHSFCYDLIRAEGEKLGISRNVRLVDEMEDRALMLDTMEAVLRDRCNSSKKFSSLTESLVGYRKDALLSKFLIELYDKLMTLPEGVEFIKRSAEDEKLAAEDDFLHSACGTALALTIKKKLAEYIGLIDACLERLPEEHNFIPVINAEKENLRAFMLSLDTGYAEAREAHKNTSEFSTLRSSAKFKEYKAEENAIKYVRDNYKSFIKSLESVFAQTESEARESALEHSELLWELYHTEKQFATAIFEAKKKAEICSFTDLEQLSIKLLYDENGNLTELAKSVSACFDCVFIDEYQDVNNTQRMIFDAIASSCKCFRVGDIKQSIYAFRGADPSIIDKLRARYDSDGETETENVFMSNNFRSKKEILDYINEVFEPHFRGGDFSYEDSDRLIGVEEESTESEPKVTVIACKNGSTKENTVSVSETSIVADEIERLVKTERLSSGKKIKYGDICILLRNYSTHNEAFVREFKKRGIPFSLQGKRKVFNEVHVRYFLSVLQCADNPTKDIPLATVLFSSLMRFDENELLSVQQLGRESMWKNLSVAAKTFGGKFADAYEKISAWRGLARRASCDSFVRYLLNDEGIRSLLISEAKTDTEKNNVAFDLDIIYSRSLAFKNEPRADFSAFVEEIEALAETNADIEAAAPKSTDAVSVMSAHASKGLEFPVCFVSRCNANRKHSDESRIAFNTDVGIGTYLTDPRGFVLVNTPTREAIKLINEQKGAGEEERILYVEFTRAKERLYITADSVPENTFSHAEAESALEGTHLPWQMSSIRASLRAAMSPRAKARLVTVNPIDKDAKKVAETVEAAEEKAFDSELSARLASTLAKRLSFEYPESFISKIPAKISVSKLSPSVLDESVWAPSDESELTAIGRPKESDFKDAPAFLSAEKKATAAEAGTATHLFLQFCDIGNAKAAGVRAEADRLLSLGFINEREYSLINEEELDAFVNSDFAARIQSAEIARREFRFNCFMPADKLTANDELREALKGTDIAVQGVIDGFFIEGDDIILFDYKTDRIKSTDDAKKIFAERYSWQISCYAEALRRIFGKKVTCAYIYSTALGKEISVPCDLIYG